jgi:hypothetical protein
MAKQRGYPDRRGMGAQSDFIAERFVPSEQYEAQQREMLQTLTVAGVSPEQMAGMFLIPPQLISKKAIEDESTI